MSHSSFVGGEATLYGPFAADRYDCPYTSYYYDTSSHVQNMRDQDAYVTSRYYRLDGTLEPGSGHTRGPVSNGGVAAFYVPDPLEGVPAGFGGSVKIRTTDASQNPVDGKISGIHNIARLNSLGNPYPGDFGCTYNMVHRR
jgi:hypothetical protein